MGCTYCRYWRMLCDALGPDWWGRKAPAHKCLYRELASSPTQESETPDGP